MEHSQWLRLVHFTDKLDRMVCLNPHLQSSVDLKTADSGQRVSVNLKANPGAVHLQCESK